MTVATLSAEVGGALWDLAWEQWSQLGVSAAPPAQREERATDPEALLLFTLHVGRYDPRLFDEVLGWLALNAPLISTQRLRNLCTDATAPSPTQRWTGRRARGDGRHRPASVPSRRPTGSSRCSMTCPSSATRVTQRSPVTASRDRR
jgi:hypothetical protein